MHIDWPVILAVDAYLLIGCLHTGFTWEGQCLSMAANLHDLLAKGNILHNDCDKYYYSYQYLFIKQSIGIALHSMNCLIQFPSFS